MNYPPAKILMLGNYEPAGDAVHPFGKSGAQIGHVRPAGHTPQNGDA